MYSVTQNCVRQKEQGIGKRRSLKCDFFFTFLKLSLNASLAHTGPASPSFTTCGWEEVFVAPLSLLFLFSSQQRKTGGLIQWVLQLLS